MPPALYDIGIISAPSNLGLRPTGVELLAASLLDAGLAETTGVQHPVIHVPTLNRFYNPARDTVTHCLNPVAIRNFSLTLGKAMSDTWPQHRFALVLGGDCSILLGIMPALKARGNYGLIFIDAHADFYEPEKSTTGEVADMDLALVTGRGPELLTNINNQRPYVRDEQVIHIAQRDWEETQHFGSQDIRKTAITRFDMEYIEKNGIQNTTSELIQHINSLTVDGYWIHFDTDVLADEINPAVEYHLPGGLLFDQATYLLHHLLSTQRIAGMSITIFNPKLDKDGHIARHITGCIGRAFRAS